MADIGGSMSKKVGGLKVWQWGTLVGGGLLVYYLYTKKSKTTSEEVQPTESFATGSQVGQGAEGSGGGSGSGGSTGTPAEHPPASGTPAEQPTPAPSAPAATAESQPAPGLGAGNLFATEVGEVLSGREALEKAGLVPPQPGANKSPVTHSKKHAHDKSKKHNKDRKKSTHAKQGQHHHEAQKHKQAKNPSPHHGATHAARAHTKPASHHTQKKAVHHAASHHTRKR